jgi:hypothetical protein
VFFQGRVNAIWSFKREGTPLSILITFFCQKNSIMLERMQVSSILNQAIMASLAIFWLPPFQNISPLPQPTYWLLRWKAFDI